MWNGEIISAFGLPALLIHHYLLYYGNHVWKFQHAWENGGTNVIGHTAGFELILELKELFLGGEQIKLQIKLVEVVRVSHS